MYTLKEKVSERLSRLFADSPNTSSSSSPPPSPLNQPPLARPYSIGGKSFSSYFSHIIPSVSFGSRSDKHQHEFQSLPAGYKTSKFKCQDEPLDDYVACSPICEDEEVENNIEKHEINDDQASRGTRGSTSSSEVYEEATDHHSPQKALSNLLDESVFISADLYEFFLSSLPNIVKGCQWVLLYRSVLFLQLALDSVPIHSNEGQYVETWYITRTLIRKSADLSGPCLLIVGDMQGAVFGGLLNCPLQPTAKRKFQGTNQTFVFTTIYGEPRLFRPTGANRYYYLCLNDLLALGAGGNFALCLDGDLLNGTSGPCETFGNMCLAHSPEFELKNVEAGFSLYGI
ncbi:hypothetical protein FNV43_RR02496 [Rhamnella rubrinervis]|uniref:TLDc domain-containing protein n=1 Tax=Rhamnella rubrinervis TaxID=2594499 RepID=A0A8K0MT12_9ROSA|nr:hypothetical protein FNV43_RR02496 [Rhamnella rubrinervis]